MSQNIAIHFCDVRKVFRLQFGQGHIFLCGGQLLQLMMNIHQNERDLFHRSLFYAYNGIHTCAEEDSDLVYQLDFGMVLVRLQRLELCEMLMLMWRKYKDLMDSVLVFVSSSWIPHRYALSR